MCVCGRLARSILTHRHTEREGRWVRRSPRTTALTMLHRVSLIVASVRNQAARIARTCSPDPLPQQTATTPGEMGESKTKLLCPNYARFDHFVLQCGRKTRVVPGVPSESTIGHDGHVSGRFKTIPHYGTGAQ